MTIRSHILAATLLLASPLAADAQTRLLDADTHDQVPTRLQAMTGARAAAASLERAPLAMSWALAVDAPLDARPQVHVAESREYWIDASAGELQGGLVLTTTANGALVRLSPHRGDAAMAIAPADITVRANARTFAGKDAIEQVADADELAAAGMDVPGGTLVFRLADAVGAGRIELVVARARGAFLVHVFEPASPVVLELGAERDGTLAGQAIRFHARLPAGGTIDQLAGSVRAPGGDVIDVAFTREADGRFVASVTPDAALAGTPGLWELHAFGQVRHAGLEVQRDARTAFAVAVASARLDGRIERGAESGRKSGGMTVRVGIEVADASRYQLAGVLYGTGTDGRLQPVAIAHAARWIEAGSGTIELAFDAAALRSATARAPYELRDLRLVNQADMSLIERRERAAILR
ncbi:MAG: DUF4785 family protein [Xanthomonadales bacterium]|nr:DUF4785 family protein [Xanthomonadales bacterium]